MEYISREQLLSLIATDTSCWVSSIMHLVNCETLLEERGISSWPLLVVRRKGSLRRCFSEKEQLRENSINLGSGKYSQSARQPHLLSQVFWTRISTLLLSLLQKWLSHLYQSCSFVRELHAKRKKKKKKNRNEGEHLSHRSTKIIQPPAPTHSSYDLLRETKRIFSMKELGMVWETRKSWLWQM